MPRPAVIDQQRTSPLTSFRRRFAALLLAFAGLGPSLPPVLAQEAVDLELVLAVDTSLSVSAQEFALQMQGLGRAFASPAVIAAIRAAGDRGIAVTVMQWSDRHQQHHSLPWTRVTDAASARAVGARIAAIPRAFGGAGTAIGGAVEAALGLFQGSGTIAPRRVIDVSGDGIDNRGPFTRSFWDEAALAGVTINGLAILNEDPYLDLYYQRNVIAGTGAFVTTAADYEDFARAILAKLVREIADAPVASLPSAGAQLGRR